MKVPVRMYTNKFIKAGKFERKLDSTGVMIDVKLHSHPDGTMEMFAIILVDDGTIVTWDIETVEHYTITPTAIIK